MCGIFGYFDLNKKELQQSSVQDMGNEMHHRGPDDQGIFYGEAIALGNQRLSIIDIAGGKQPFISDDKSIVVVQNGEIFNHIELAEELKGTRYECRTHSDTEVLLRLYEKDGIDFVSKLNGMFAIAIYDKRTDEVFLIRDRIGVKPLYITDTHDRILFASEIKSIFKAGFPAEINELAIHNYLSFNYVPPPQTAFKNISHLNPGSWLCINRKTRTRKMHQWWDLSSIKQEKLSEQEWQEAILATLDDAVRIRLRADVPFGAFLSGGIDSSTVVGLMAKHRKDPVLTYSIGFEDPKYDETPFALEAAARFGTKHHSEIVSPDMLDLWPMALYHCDQPHGDISFLPTYRVSELAAKEVKMVLTGDGGDELFAGYEKYLNYFNTGNATSSRSTFEQSYFDSISLFNSDSKQKAYQNAFNAKVKDFNSASLVSPLFAQTQHWDRINQALYVDMMLLLSGNNLVKPDRMGMAVSLEARTPFLDYRMMELAFKIPGELKLRDGETKYILKKAVKNLIGENLAYRKKQMFTVPVGDWFKTKLADYCRNLLLSDSSYVLSIFTKEALTNILDSHIAGKANFTREIRAILAIELWAKKFLSL